MSNYELLHEQGGLLDFFDTDPRWLHKYMQLPRVVFRSARVVSDGSPCCAGIPPPCSTTAMKLPSWAVFGADQALTAL